MALTNAYATVEQLRVHMNDERDIAHVDMLERALNAASRWIDEVCGRKFWLDEAVTTRLYKPTEADMAWVDDIGTTTGLIVGTDSLGNGVFDTTWTIATDFELAPENADAEGDAYAWWRIAAVGDRLFPLTGRRKSLRVTAKHGWSAIPAGVEAACLLRAYALFKRKSSPTGIQGFEGFGMRTTRDDPDIRALLSPYVKTRIGAV